MRVEPLRNGVREKMVCILKILVGGRFDDPQCPAADEKGDGNHEGHGDG